MSKPKILCWLRRDLRLHDHRALSYALNNGEVILVFNFDPFILNQLQNKCDLRVQFIIDSLKALDGLLQKYSTSLIITCGPPEEEIPKLAKKLDIFEVVFNRDYEPYAKSRDNKVQSNLAALGINSQHFKDHVFFEKDEVKKSDGEIYRVFTPYKNKWIDLLNDRLNGVEEYTCELKHLFPLNKHEKFKKFIFNEKSIEQLGFTNQSLPLGLEVSQAKIKKQLTGFKEKIAHYHQTRDFPAQDGTSHLSVYLRMGNISIRECLRLAIAGHSSEGHRIWHSELIWRDFFQMILDAHPEVVNDCYNKKYQNLTWSKNMDHFQAWCRGETGFPIIDSAMRCLNETGWMHNRLRMVTASFLTKILLIDWRLGERYFAQKLLDYDLAANNGNWQWCASTGVDACPYFRIFNPESQAKKFDPHGDFIRKWGGKTISPIVDYKAQRELALHVFSTCSKL